MPDPAPHEVVVRVSKVGICGSDVHYFEHGRIGHYVVDGPLILGHEASGTVVAVGSAVVARAPGDRVAIEPGVPCRRCQECRAGRYNLCPDVRFLATPPYDGALVDHLAVDAEFAHPLPPGVSLVAGALVEPFSVGLWAVHKAGVSPGDRVLVTGAGPIGLMAVLAARTAGATVSVVEPAEHRRAVALELGAVDAAASVDVDAADEVDSLIECSGSTVLAAAMARVRPAGSVVVVGMSPDPTSAVPMQLVQNRELVVTGTFRYANTYPRAIDLVAGGVADVEQVVTSLFPLEQAADALIAARDDPRQVKVVVDVDGSRA